MAILIAGIGRSEERRSGVRARPLLTGKACSVAGRAAAQLPQLSCSCQLPQLRLARPGHQLPVVRTATLETKDLSKPERSCAKCKKLLTSLPSIEVLCSLEQGGNTHS